jgi:hypothetical protein
MRRCVLDGPELGADGFGVFACAVERGRTDAAPTPRPAAMNPRRFTTVLLLFVLLLQLGFAEGG